VSVSAGSLDLDGQNLLGRPLAGYNSVGHNSDGEFRNQNPWSRSIINGDTTGLGTYQACLFGGVGDILYTGDIVDTRSGRRFYKVGPGTLTMTGATLSPDAPTGVVGGGLVLDFSVTNAPKIVASADLLLVGNLTLLGGETAVTQTVGNVVIGLASENFYNRVRIAPQSATFRFGTLAFDGAPWTDAIAVDFAPDATGRVLTKAANDASLNALSPRVTFQGKSFARVADGPSDADGYRAVEAVTQYAADFTTAGQYDFVDVIGHATNTAPASATFAALRFNDDAPSSLTLLGNLRLFGEGTLPNNNPCGAILVTPRVGTNTVTIGGSTIHAGIGNGSLTIHQYNTNAPLVIASQIYDSHSGGLTKTGPGELVLTAANSCFTRLHVLEGILTVYEIADSAVPSPVGVYTGIINTFPLTLCDATFRYLGEGHATDRQFRIRGKSVIEASGAGPLVFTNAFPLLRPSESYGGNPLLTLSGTGEGIVEGTLNPAYIIHDTTTWTTLNPGGGRVIKRGCGKWTLSATSDSSLLWGLDVLEGTLALDGTFGRDVRVHKNATLAGNGNITHDLILHDGAILSLTPNSSLPTLNCSVLTVGRNLHIAGGASLDLPRKLPPDWTPVLEVRGEIYGAFEIPGHAYHKIENGVLSVKLRPVGTLLMVR